ncbi:MAG: hypothetical protein AMJ60_10295 [Desulfobacterales bacterium SG8_35]|nr:MAG: hypothetical protein AMJ60_10295 [Desulfobacterales bacterium SG8_35]
MSLRVEQDCPQCGGPLEMAETDRLLRCNFCNVQSFLANKGPLHFVLPRRQPDPYTIYAPYLRFRGTIYSCLSNRIEQRLADISTRGVKLSFLPTSLGLRPQAMKMRFATPQLPGSYLKRSIPEAEILKRAAKNLHIRDEEILHQTFIGDGLNLIYLPLSIRDEEILDGVVEQTLARIPENSTPFGAAEIDSHAWKPIFLPALCPQCGWNLEGEPDSVVLLCSNCNSAWQAGGKNFSAVRIKFTPAKNPNAIFIPFWNFKVSAAGINLNSFADFIRITNQALLIKPEWEDMELYIVNPAFKVRPKDFLRLSTQMTISRRYTVQTNESVPKKSLHPVTLTHGDAGRSLKVILANSAVSRSNVFPHLPEIQFEIKEYFLHYLPFEKTSHELNQAQLGVTINQRVLNYGRSL